MFMYLKADRFVGTDDVPVFLQAMRIWSARAVKLGKKAQCAERDHIEVIEGHIERSDSARPLYTMQLRREVGDSAGPGSNGEAGQSGPREK